MTFSWSNLQKPIFVLAPMEEVTDVAFREMFARYGKPDVMYTEFVPVDGLLHPEGYEKLKMDLLYTENQRPIIAQIWGRDPEKFTRVAEMVAKLGFDGIDINMGCPQSKEIAAGACAALIRDPKLAQEIVRATRKGAGNLPVSVKTRIGYSRLEEMEDWLMHLLELELPALTLHARTKKEMSKVPAHWDKIAEAVQIRNREKSNTLIIGNGDVKSREDGLQKIAATGADGVMIARGAFGNPWIFKTYGGRNPEAVSSSIGQVASTRPAPTFQSFMSPDVKSMADNRLNFSSVIASPNAAEGEAIFSLQKIATTSDKALTSRNDTSNEISVQERLRVMLENAELFDSYFRGIKSFTIMRKHFKAYCSGFPGASELRAKLMETKDLEETKKVVEEYFSGLS